MSFSEVPRIELTKDGKVTLYVNVGGFKVGTPVEISGYATQANGAIATFHYVQPMPVGDLVDGVIMVVKDVPVFGPPFEAREPVTVIARAADAWITKLDLAPSEDLPKLLKGTGAGEVFDKAWKSVEGSYHSIYSSDPPPEESGLATSLMRHGTWWDRRKTESLDEVMGGRFTRLFPDLIGASFAQTDLELLATAMTVQQEEPEQEPENDPEENPGVPAAYTYLGQFVDHDLTFDPISHLRETLSPAQLKELVDFRTPRFDLDNLYGRGPDDQPYMYDNDGIHLLPGRRLSGDPFDPSAVDLPRAPRPSSRALIGDPRNDENRIVAQLHAIFLRFHNAVADRMAQKKNVSFKEVRDQVRWHYQWVLVNDFLRKILQQETYDSVFPNSYRPVTTIPKLRENDLELMPVEFSVAAYRFGHSMIRPRYQLNPTIGHPIPIPIFSDDPDNFTADLGGFRPIPHDWAIDWQFFINLGHDAEREPQLSYKIDTSLVHPLGNLPERVAKDPSSLALRNLERGATFQLPSGQQVAEALDIPPIANEDLMIGMATAGGQQRRLAEVVPGFGRHAPLWAYVLSEAQVMSWRAHPGQDEDKIPIRLGPVGGRLVAEVFASLLRGDHTSYLYAEPTFKPIADFNPNGTFGLAELINVALRHRS
jgi:hypothetical protein